MTMVTRATKSTRPLPTRSGLNELGKTRRTIVDYAKKTPLRPQEPTASVVQVMRPPRRAR
jgi:hypothetical protein